MKKTQLTLALVIMKNPFTTAILAVIACSTSTSAAVYNLHFGGTLINYNPTSAAAGAVGTGAIFRDINYDIGQSYGGTQNDALIDGKKLDALAQVTYLSPNAAYNSSTSSGNYPTGTTNGFRVNATTQALQYDIAGNGDVFAIINIQFGFYDDVSGSFQATSITADGSSGLLLQVFDIDSLAVGNPLSDVLGYIPSEFTRVSLSPDTDLQITAAGDFAPFDGQAALAPFTAVDLTDATSIRNIGFGETADQIDATVEFTPGSITTSGLDFAWGFRNGPSNDPDAVRAFLLLGQNPPLFPNVPEPSVTSLFALAMFFFPRRRK